MVAVEIKWSPNAIRDITRHYSFLALKSKKSAEELYDKLRTAPNILLTSPFAGQIEPLLEDMPISFRYLVAERRYKLIYTVTDHIVEIHAVWDCRQSEEVLKQTINPTNE
jgi:plasmid stabilization system protein ParE